MHLFNRFERYSSITPFRSSLSLDKSATLFMVHLLKIESQKLFALLAKEAK